MDIGIGFLYNLVKDFYKWVKSRFTYTEQIKYVELAWLEKTPLKKAWESEGYELAWPDVSKKVTKELDGWVVMYEFDKKSMVKYKFIVKNKPDLLLMGRKNAPK